MLQKQNEKAITLIALVITIIVLLILAGVSIVTLSGENGILTMANKATLQNEAASVVEQIELKCSENNISQILNGNSGDSIEYLKAHGIINDENIINTENLTGQKTKYGNGTSTDIFKISGNKIIYKDSKGNITFEKDIQVKFTPFVTKWNVAAGDKVVLPIAYKANNGSENDNDFVVDWGDGSAKEIIKGAPDTRPEHTYANSGKYNISITGICKYFTFDSIESEYPEMPKKLVELVSWGEIQAESYNFGNAINLSGSIPSPGTNTFMYVSSDSFEYLFSGCEKITTIPEDLFANIPEGITTFKSTFQNCKSLTQIPENLFEKATEVTKFYNTFSCCSSLKEIPKKLFSNTTKVTDFSKVFRDCSALETIPEELFANTPEVVSFWAAFKYDSNLINVPTNLFDNNLKATNFVETFTDDWRLTDVPKLWERTTEGLNGKSCYKGCEDYDNSQLSADIINVWFK